MTNKTKPGHQNKNGLQFKGANVCYDQEGLWMSCYFPISAEQRRCVREVAASHVFTSLCGSDASAEGEGADGDEAGAQDPLSPLERRASPHGCSTPIAKH